MDISAIALEPTYIFNDDNFIQIATRSKKVQDDVGAFYNSSLLRSFPKSETAWIDSLYKLLKKKNEVFDFLNKTLIEINVKSVDVIEKLVERNEATAFIKNLFERFAQFNVPFDTFAMTAYDYYGNMLQPNRFALGSRKSKFPFIRFLQKRRRSGSSEIDKSVREILSQKIETAFNITCEAIDAIGAAMDSIRDQFSEFRSMTVIIREYVEDMTAKTPNKSSIQALITNVDSFANAGILSFLHPVWLPTAKKQVEIVRRSIERIIDAHENLPDDLGNLLPRMPTREDDSLCLLNSRRLERIETRLININKGINSFYRDPKKYLIESFAGTWIQYLNELSANNMMLRTSFERVIGHLPLKNIANAASLLESERIKRRKSFIPDLKKYFQEFIDIQARMDIQALDMNADYDFLNQLLLPYVDRIPASFTSYNASRMKNKVKQMSDTVRETNLAISAFSKELLNILLDETNRSKQITDGVRNLASYNVKINSKLRTNMIKGIVQYIGEQIVKGIKNFKEIKTALDDKVNKITENIEKRRNIQADLITELETSLKVIHPFK